MIIIRFSSMCNDPKTKKQFVSFTIILMNLYFICTVWPVMPCTCTKIVNQVPVQHKRKELPVEHLCWEYSLFCPFWFWSIYTIRYSFSYLTFFSCRSYFMYIISLYLNTYMYSTLPTFCFYIILQRLNINCRNDSQVTSRPDVVYFLNQTTTV